MKREILVGYTKDRIQSRPKSGRVTIEMELRDTDKGPEFAASGNVWNSSGNDIEMGGQCVDKLADEVSTWNITREAYARIVELWKAHHLNGMKAGCEHQRAANWHICPGHYSATTNTWVPRRKTSYGETGGYNDQGLLGTWIYGALKNVKQFEIPEKGLRLIVEDDGIMVTRRVEWTFQNCANETEAAKISHPGQTVYCSKNMLSKPCPECGYKYGHAWLYAPIPENDLREIKAIIAGS